MRLSRNKVRRGNCDNLHFEQPLFVQLNKVGNQTFAIALALGHAGHRLWSLIYLYISWSTWFYEGMHFDSDCWIHKRDYQSSYTFIILIHYIATCCKLMNTTFAVLVCACRGERDAQTHAVACIFGITPSADFWCGDHFNLLVRGAESLATIVGRC